MTAPTIEFVTSIPEPTRAVKGGGSGNVYSQTMRSMPAPAAGKKKGDPMNYASFFVAASVPSTITDEKEKLKAAKDACRKLSNQFSSLTKRVKRDNPTMNFAFRTLQDANGIWGLRVYRVEDVTAPADAPGAPAA